MSRYKRIPEAVRRAAASYTREWPTLPVHGSRPEDIARERQIRQLREKQATREDPDEQATRMTAADEPLAIGAIVKRMESALWGHGTESSEVIRCRADAKADGFHKALDGITQRMATQDLTRID
eukprot:5851223-Prymnesium_polylepis.1